jgi:hypothetical protein
MIDTKQVFDAIPAELIESLINYYDSIGEYDTNTMNKAHPGSALDMVRAILETHIGKKLDYVQGNFYKHSKPYLPHTDYKTYQDGNINVVIPLSFTNTVPHLIIFDQIWNLDSVTWCMNYPVQRFEVNIGVKGSPYEYPVIGLTNSNIDTDLYIKYLRHYAKDTLFGLSGKAYSFSPGSIIIFDAKKIHCTSNMQGEKLGLTLRFK